MSLPAQAPQDTGQDGAVPVAFCMCLHPSVPAGPCAVLPSPALPCPFSRTAAISQKREAARGELLPPALPRAGQSRLMPRATPGADCTLGRLSPVEPSKEHLPDPLQLVGSLQERGVRSLPAPSHLAQAGDTGAMDGLQKPSAAPFTSSLAR